MNLWCVYLPYGWKQLEGCGGEFSVVFYLIRHIWIDREGQDFF